MNKTIHKDYTHNVTIPNHPTPNGGNRKLYIKNIKAIFKHQPDLYVQLMSLDMIESKVVGSLKKNSLNIDIGHSLFYQHNVYDYCQQQIKSFMKNPMHLDLPWLNSKIKYQYLNGDFYNRIARFKKKHRLYKMPPLKQYDGGATVVFGLGLGYHIAPLIENFKARSVLVIEQFIEFLHHSMYYQPFYQWYKECKKNHGNFILLISDSPENLADHAYNIVNRQLFGQIDGSIIFRHYHSSFLETVYQSFYKNLPVINANPGFFEDEIVMIKNFYANGTKSNYKTLLATNTPLEKKVPIFICGNGPSLDKAIPKIREFQDRAIIVSCGSAIGPLLKAGINPDFQTELENINRVTGMHYIQEMLEPYGKDFKNIHLVASFSIESELYDMFDKVTLFFRGSVVPSFIWSKQSEALLNAVPTVGNVGLSMAMHMGFQEIYLVGIDMGARADQPHHAKDSLYYTHGEEIVKKGLRMPDKYKIPNRGNLGGTVYSDDIFIYAGMFLSTISRGINYSNHEAKIYNCSDGLRFANMIPKLIDLVNISSTTTDKNMMINEINRELSPNLYKRFINIDIAKELCRNNRQMINSLRRIINKHQKMLINNIIDYHMLYVDIKKLFYKFQSPHQQDDANKRSILPMYNGTILMCYSILFTIMHRVDKKYHGELMHEALDQFHNIIDVMDSQSTNIFNWLYKDAFSKQENQ